MPLPERYYSLRPDRIVMVFDENESLQTTQNLAESAVDYARAYMPRITGSLARSLLPIYGPNFWGIYFPDKRAWFLEQGTNPFTMNSLAGKTIPMWIDDPDGEQAKEIGRKAKTRITEDGRRQTLIFRKAAARGSRKWIRRRGVLVSVPRSYPGAPGRISNRGDGGRISSPNGGVRWRHPGIIGRGYLNQAMTDAASDYGVEPKELRLIDSATYSTATRG